MSMVAISSADQNVGYLASKIIGGANMTVSIQAPGGDERLSLSAVTDRGTQTALIADGDFVAVPASSSCFFLISALSGAGEHYGMFFLTKIPGLPIIGVSTRIYGSGVSDSDTPGNICAIVDGTLNIILKNNSGFSNVSVYYSFQNVR